MEAAVEKRWSVTVSDLQAWWTYILNCQLRAMCEKHFVCLFVVSRTTVFLVPPYAVCPFGMADWLNWLRAFIIYTVLLIKKKKCEKSSVASAALSVALCGLPLRSRSLRAEDRIQNQEQRSRLCCSITRIRLWIAADNLLQTFHRKIASNIVSFEVLLISRINCNTVLCCVSAWSDMSIKTFDIRRVV